MPLDTPRLTHAPSTDPQEAAYSTSQLREVVDVPTSKSGGEDARQCPSERWSSTRGNFKIYSVLFHIYL